MNQTMMGKLSLACLLLLAVEGLRLEKPETAKSQKKKKVLLLLTGLMRDFQNKWPIWRKTVIERNEKLGFTFKIVVNTDLRYTCDLERLSGPILQPALFDQAWPDSPEFRDPGNEFHRQYTCHCQRPPDEYNCSEIIGRVGSADKEAFKRHILEVLKPYDAEVIDDPEIDQRSEIQVVRTGQAMIKMAARNETFDMVLSFRPDMVLVHGTGVRVEGQREGEGGPAELNLNEICANHPGFNIISGDVTRPYQFHDRDWDWANLLCDGSKLQDVGGILLADHHDVCSNERGECQNGQPPPLPSDFTPSTPWACDSYACKWVYDLGKLGMRFGNLDDVVLGHKRGGLGWSKELILQE